MSRRPEEPAVATAGGMRPPARFSDRYRPYFERWAHGRIPPWARPLLDPRVVVGQTFSELALDDARTAVPADGALLEQVRRALYDKVLAAVKRVALEIARESATIAFTLPLRDAGLERELLERYETGLARLPEDERRAVLARTELALPWAEVSPLLAGEPDTDPRLTVSRALVHLAREMAHDR